MLILFVWILSSWIPQFRQNAVMAFCGRLSEPYLRLFRSVIPPIGGMLDVSPMLAFFVLGLVRQIIFTALGP